MANEYDKILKEIFTHTRVSIIEALIGVKVVSIRSLLPKMQQTTIEKEADMVAEIVTEAGGKFVVHIEWQSDNDKRMQDRMFLYHAMLRMVYGLPVLGIVVYLGNKPLKMPSSISSMGLEYHFNIIDIRELEPSIFLSSNDPAQWVFSILTGKESWKTEMVKELLHKLHSAFKGEPNELVIKFKQLEILSLLRGREFQKKLIQEEENMPVTIDITQDYRYRQGEGKGKLEEKFEAAVKMLERGLSISLVQDITGLDVAKIAELANKAKTGNKK